MKIQLILMMKVNFKYLIKYLKYTFFLLSKACFFHASKYYVVSF